MEASNRMYTELVNNQVQFVIPAFQRDYNWEEEQCEQLWEDVLRVGHNAHGHHFFGPLVYISTEVPGAAFTKWLLIDGQQRMTTVSLLMAAVRDHIRDQPSAEGLGAQEVEHLFLKNYQRGDGRPKLKLRRRDEATFRWIVDGADEPPEKSVTVKGNYEFFRKKMRDADAGAVHAGVRSLAVVDVRLERNRDDPQQIFESLNSTGLDLTQADLVRNYVLMGLDERLQTELYNKYWRKIGRLYTGGADQLDNFLRDFVALETSAQKQVRAHQIYSSFRIQFDERRQDPDSLEMLLLRMTRFARFHAAFTMGSRDFDHVAECLARLRALAITPAILVMRLLDTHDRNYLDDESLAEALDLIESYIVRRDVCGFQTNSYWRRFAELAYGLRMDDCLKSLKVNLCNLPNSYAFPKDREFQHALEQEELYGRRICRTVLERLENANSRERTDTSGYTIEHIMPQNRNLSRDWTQMLGEGWEDVQETWVHRLGNLTLTAYNETYSDRSFEEKKAIRHGFHDSPLRLNRDVRDQNRWTASEMEGRGQRLAQRALGIWSSLDVPDEWLREAEVNRLREEAEQGNIQDALDNMDEDARELFEGFRDQVRAFGGDIIEVARPKSVSYYNPRGEFFCEVLPRARRVQVLFPMYCEEAVECDIAVEDAKQYKFFAHAWNEAGSFVYIHSAEDVHTCKVLVRQALAASTD